MPTQFLIMINPWNLIGCLKFLMICSKLVAMAYYDYKQACMNDEIAWVHMIWLHNIGADLPLLTWVL